MTKPWKELGRYGGVGIELVLAILILAGLGHWLDERYGHGQIWGMSIGFIFGVAVGVRNLVRTAGRMQGDIERAEAQDPEAGRWKVDDGWVHKPQDEGHGAAGTDGRDAAAGDDRDDARPTGRGRKAGDDLPS
jgi:Putative F0F1-ATPase subunit Ca2+/Mg2+ transporter